MPREAPAVACPFRTDPRHRDRRGARPRRVRHAAAGEGHRRSDGLAPDRERLGAARRDPDRARHRAEGRRDRHGGVRAQRQAQHRAPAQGAAHQPGPDQRPEPLRPQPGGEGLDAVLRQGGRGQRRRRPDRTVRDPALGPGRRRHPDRRVRLHHLVHEVPVGSAPARLRQGRLDAHLPDVPDAPRQQAGRGQLPAGDGRGSDRLEGHRGQARPRRSTRRRRPPDLPYLRTAPARHAAGRHPCRPGADGRHHQRRLPPALRRAGRGSLRLRDDHQPRAGRGRRHHPADAGLRRQRGRSARSSSTAPTRRTSARRPRSCAPSTAWPTSTSTSAAPCPR